MFVQHRAELIVCDSHSGLRRPEIRTCPAETLCWHTDLFLKACFWKKPPSLTNTQTPAFWSLCRLQFKVQYCGFLSSGRQCSLTLFLSQRHGSLLNLQFQVSGPKAPEVLVSETRLLIVLTVHLRSWNKSGTVLAVFLFFSQDYFSIEMLSTPSNTNLISSLTLFLIQFLFIFVRWILTSAPVIQLTAAPEAPTHKAQEHKKWLQRNPGRKWQRDQKQCQENQIPMKKLSGTLSTLYS